MTVSLMRWLIAIGFLTSLYGNASAQTKVPFGRDTVLVSLKHTPDTVLKVRVDTVYIPQLPAGRTPVLFGGSQYPVDSLGPVYTVTVKQLAPATMADDLQRIRTKHGRIVLTLSRWFSRDTLAGDSVLSVAALQKHLATWPDTSVMNPYFRDGTILQIRTSDDIMSKAIWGNDAPNKPRLDSLGLVVKQKYPLAKTSLRALPTQMIGYTWKWTDYAWAQYAKIDRLGTPEQYRDNQNASAKAQGLCLVFGFNATGYDESTAAEIETYGKVFGAYTPYFTYWWYETPYSERPEIKAAFQKLRSAMDTTSYRGCPK